MTRENTENTATDLRTRLRAGRSAMTDASRSRGALLMRARLCAWLGTYRSESASAGRPAPAVIAAFWPMADEPDLRPLLTQWSDDPALTVALPVIESRGTPLRFDRWHPNMAMTEGAYGIAIPQRSQPVMPDVVLVPTLGYTAQGDRVGYGAGYYDRTLAAWREVGHRPVAIGIAWATGKLDAAHVPAPHDQRLDAILTEDGWLPAAPGQAPSKPTRSLFSVRLGG